MAKRTVAAMSAIRALHQLQQFFVHGKRKDAVAWEVELILSNKSSAVKWTSNPINESRDFHIMKLYCCFHCLGMFISASFNLYNVFEKE